jgi:hypothetical protein
LYAVRILVLIGFVPLGFDVGFFCRFSNIPFI